MASLVVVPIAETLQGIAFEVMMQSSIRQCMETPVSQRLRSYATSFDKDPCRDLDVLPTLLKSRPFQTLATEEHATKAKGQNDHQQKVVEHLRTEHSRLANHKQHVLEQRMVKASDGREAMLSARKVVAGRHFEAVKAKVDISRQRQAIATTALALRLEETDMRKEFTHRVYLAERSARAGQHNQAVVEKLRQHEMAKERQAEELRSKSPCEKFSELCLRLHEHHSLSRLQA